MKSFIKNNILVITIVIAIFLSPLLTFLTKSISAYALALLIPYLILIVGLKLSKKDLGLFLPKNKGYLILAIIFPLGVFSIITILATLFGQLHFYDNPTAFKIRFPLMLLALLIDVVITSVFLIFTEEGFFRGVLVAGMIKQGYSQKKTLIVSNALFAIWHIAALVLFPESKISITLIPIYITNALVVGIIWSILRIKSGSIWPAIISHAIWNTYAYYLFGIGTTMGLLGIETTEIFDPERGLLGIVMSLMSLFFIYWFFFSNRKNLHK